MTDNNYFDWEEDDPQWLRDLVDEICDCCISEVSGRMSPFSCRACPDEMTGEGVWLVQIAPSPGELVGGNEDGTMIFDPPHINLQDLSDLFEHDEHYHFEYNPGTPHLKEPDHIALWSKRVRLQIFFGPFDESDPSWVLEKGGWREHRGT
jgi:hypothetical protein